MADSIRFHPSMRKQYMQWICLALAFTAGSVAVLGINITALAAIWGIAVLMLIVRFAQRRFTTVELGSDSLAVDTGVLNTRHTVIPYAKITEFNMRRSIIDRMAGVARVEVDTAGASAGAEIVLNDVPLEYAKLMAGHTRTKRAAAPDYFD